MNAVKHLSYSKNNKWHLTCSTYQWRRTVPGICLAVILSSNNVLKQLSSCDTAGRVKRQMMTFILNNPHTFLSFCLNLHWLWCINGSLWRAIWYCLMPRMLMLMLTLIHLVMSCNLLTGQRPGNGSLPLRCCHGVALWEEKEPEWKTSIRSLLSPSLLNQNICCTSAALLSWMCKWNFKHFSLKI